MKVVTYNGPARYGPEKIAADVQRYSERPGVGVIGVNEVNDDNAPRTMPKGWRKHRPRAERSSAIYWDPDNWKVLKRGKFRVHSSGWDTPRYIVWVTLEHRRTRTVIIIGEVHLVAFKTSRPSHGREYRRQVLNCAEWLDRPGDRVLMGDFNGEPGSKWLDPIDDVANAHKPRTDSGPGGAGMIDIVYRKKGPPAPSGAKTLPGAADHEAVEAEVDL